MSLDDRFCQALDDAIADIRTRVSSQFASTITEARAEAERDKTRALNAAEAAHAFALAAATGAVEAQLMLAFQAERDGLLSSHHAVLLQTREGAEAVVTRLRGEAALEADHLREQADSAGSAARGELRQALADAASQRDSLEALVAQARQNAAAAVETARAEGAAALASYRQEHAAALAVAHAEAHQAAAAHSHATEAQLTGAIRLLESVRALDGASSLTEVLDGLTIAAAREAGRSAMLVVKGDRLIGWRASGFGHADDEPRSIESSTADAGALGVAVTTGRSAAVGNGSAHAAPPFSQLPPDRPGLAAPLLVAGRPVAVLYADPGASSPVSPGWTSPVEVLVRHAGRCLEALTIQRGAQAKVAAPRAGMPA